MNSTMSPKFRPRHIRMAIAGAIALVSIVSGAAFAEPVIPMPDWPVEMSTASKSVQHTDIGQAPLPESKELDADSSAAGPAESGKPIRTKKPDSSVAKPSDPAETQSIPPAGKAETTSVNSKEPAAQTESAHASSNSMQVTSDPITQEQISILKETGLIARQSAISESILIMERQLRQAELITQLLAVLGPDSPIEIAPGEFRNFADTPAGRRIALEIAREELEARIRLVELTAKEALLADRNALTTVPLIEANDIPDELIADDAASEWPELLEIFGVEGSLNATFELEGQEITAGPGDDLPDGSTVRNISYSTVQLIKNDIVRDFKLGW